MTQPLLRPALFLALLLAFAGSGAASFAAQGQGAGSHRSFWVRNFESPVIDYRLVNAALLARGERTDFYVEDGFSVSPFTVAGLLQQQESLANAGALYPGLGTLPALEQIFGPLPSTPRDGNRLVVLFTNFGEFFPYGGAYSTAADGLTEAIAQARGLHSNEANVVYLEIGAAGAPVTASLLARETYRLISYPRTALTALPSVWLWQTLSESSQLALGVYGAQSAVDQYLALPQEMSLVTRGPQRRGPQALFASFLIDSFSDPAGFLRELQAYPLPDLLPRELLAAQVRQQTGVPVTFDLIFGNFLSYIFENEGSSTLPRRLVPAGQTGLRLPAATPFASLATLPATVEGSLLPYSFALVQLAEPLPPTAVVSVRALNEDVVSTCPGGSTALWKPVSPTKIVVYAVGCEHRTGADRLRFRLTILAQPTP